MLESFHIAATGMHGQQAYVDMIANNLANINTTAFKKSNINFEDLVYRQIVSPASLVSKDQVINSLGAGTAVSGISKVFTQGEIKNTERQLDVAIQGDGFFEALLPDGSYAYTRTGSLQLNADGLLSTQDGNVINPTIQVPSDAQSIQIRPDGTFLVQLAGESDFTEIGRIELAKFINPTGLNPVGNNLYLPTDKSGDAFYGVPGEDGFGSLSQGFIESSNVNLIEELTNLILAQRSYEMNSKVIQTADEMLGIVNNMKR